MLLRVVVAAGAGAVLGAAACGGRELGPESGPEGSAYYPDGAAEAEPCAEGCGFAPGSMAYPEAGGPMGAIDGSLAYDVNMGSTADVGPAPGLIDGGDAMFPCNGFCPAPEGGED